jgi:hypothetical protein
MNANTIAGTKAACARILEDVDEGEDVRRIDVNTAVIRYHNRSPGVLAPNSLAVYQSRVTRAISDFIRYVENPTGFKPRGHSATANNGPVGKSKRDKKTAGSDEDGAPLRIHIAPTASVSAGLPLSFPLRPDFLAQVVIPRDLTAEEARRLGAFLLTLATDFRPGISDSSI